MSDLNRSIKIYIDGSEAQTGIAKVEAAIQKLQARLAGLNQSEADYETKSRQLQDELTRKNRTLETYRRKVEETERVLKNLSGATYNELLSVQKQLRKELQNAVPGTEKYTQTMEQYQRVVRQTTAAQQAMRVEVGAQGSLWSRAADGFNRYAGLMAGGIATLTGMTLTMRQCVDEYAKMEEAESQVIKYTGMTREEVRQLNEQFKSMDTRTPREELNRLAGEAGKLGITGVDNVRQFVEAADMINVALGEDLGEEAVNQIGKLSQMFGDESRSLKDNMLAIGSAVNQVAQSTSASEPYLVQFTARMGGVGKQANMSVTDIMGFASALDQNMLRSEMASTALSGLIMRIYQEPAKYAKLAQMDVEQFTQLVQTDVNQAVLMFLESLNKMGGMAQIAPVLKEMQLSGAEAASVITTLAGNVDMVRREQANANQAFREGTSILNEYNVQNNTVQAGLDKARKQFQEVRVELGERLQPVMKNMISLGSLTVKGVLELIRIYNEYKTLIIATSTAIAAYTVAVNASVIADKAKVLWTGRIVTGLRTLTKVIRANPWGLAITAVTALAGLLVDLRRKQDSVIESMRSMERINQSTAKEYDEQASKIEMLNAVLHDESQAMQRRAAALEELKSIIPGYNGMLDEEGKLTGDNTQAIKDYLVQLEKQIKLKAAQEELEELYRRKRQSEKQLATDEANLTTARRNLNVAETTASMRASQAGTTGTRNLMTGLDQGVKTMRTEFEKAEQAVTQTKEELAGVEQAIADVNREILSSSSKAHIDDALSTSRQDLNPIEAQPLSTAGSAAPANLPPDPAKVAPILTDAEVEANNLQQALDYETALYERHQRELKEAYISRQDETLQSEAEYNEALEQLNLMHLERLLDITGLDAERRKAVEEELLDFKMKCVNEELEEQQRAADEKARREEADAKRMQANYQKRVQTYTQYGQQVGAALGNIIAGQEDAMQGFADTMLDIVFDVLTKIVQAEIIKATATATSAVARSTAEAYATPDSVLTFGASGTARAAILSALIMGALAAAKTALKGLINNSRSSSSSSDSSESGTSYRRVAQHAAGRYDVIGSEDGHRYRGVPYIGPAPTGIVSSPALISENGAELIVNADDLNRLRRHINYPLVVQAIEESRKPSIAPQVSQHAQGNYPLPPANHSATTPQNEAADPRLLNRLTTAIERLERNGVSASVVLTELERKQQLRNRARKIGSKH